MVLVLAGLLALVPVILFALAAFVGEQVVAGEDDISIYVVQAMIGIAIGAVGARLLFLRRRAEVVKKHFY
jgi:cyanate permease